MSNITVLVATYIFGGFTLIPLLIALTLLYSVIALPRDARFRKHPQRDELFAKEEVEEGNSELKTRLEDGNREADVAASYFAVCREYVPGGINGKPPERTTPAGETIAAESPSVYQSMYRSIFDRNKSQSPTIEAGKPMKRARNVFYVVLRHGHLMLFDDSDQLEVRHVIALAHYKVDIYGGDDVIPEGELYIKRNSIRLSRTRSLKNASANLAPFFLFSDNCSEKEDFYHALLSSQRKLDGPASELPVAQPFETEDMIKLIRLLHVSEENIQHRWLNALVGRIFLALYKTPEIESMLRKKIKKKIARVRKPAFITSLTLEDLSLGESAPVFNNLKLRDVNVDGGVTLEADVKYTGKFRAVISAVAKIELGQRFKPREVDLVLSGVLNRLDGHLLFRIKPPPSNRIWMSFETMPKLEMAIEPIVSTRQITYGVIIRAIESRIREVFGETLVYPNWDDVPFTSSESHLYRGGIWKADAQTDPQALSAEEDTEYRGDNSADESISESPMREQTLNRPHLKSSQTDPAAVPTGSQSVSANNSQSEPPLQAPPMSMRSNSFAAPAVASPAVVTKIPVASDKAGKRSSSKRRDAASSMKSLSSRSQESSPLNSPTRHSETLIPQRARKGSLPSASDVESLDEVVIANGRRSTDSMKDGVTRDVGVDITSHTDHASLRGGDSPSSYAAKERSTFASSERAIAVNQAITSATTAARKWGLGVIQRSKDSDDTKFPPKASGISTISEPMGRGQPLPPLGEPLPRPDPKGWTTGAFGALKRKPVPGSSVTSLPSLSDLLQGHKGVKAETASAGPAETVPSEDESGHGDGIATLSASEESSQVNQPESITTSILTGEDSPDKTSERIESIEATSEKMDDRAT